MLLEWRDQDNVEKGRKLGREEGAESLGRLISALLEQGRIDDVAKAAADPQERACLAAELGIEIAAK